MQFYYKINSSVRSFLLLSRIFLSASVGFSGWVSYLKYSGSVTPDSFVIFLGIFLLASGASTLNQFQERLFDVRMTRTMGRPLPSGLMTGVTVIMISAFLIITGLFILLYFGGQGSFAAGLFSILWYNLLYTYLKRKSPYALFPGVLTGMIPILIGWFAAGGSWADTDCILIAAFMCVWQIPHFLLLLLHYREDYKKAGFPLLTDHFNDRSIHNIIIVAMLLIAIIMGLFVIYGTFIALSLKIVSLTLTGFILLLLVVKMNSRHATNYGSLMIMLNSYMLLIMVLLLADSLTARI